LSGNDIPSAFELGLRIVKVRFLFYRPFHDNCNPTFIWDICEWKNADFSEKQDVINTFICSTTSFYGKGYYFHSQMSQMNAGPQLS